MKARGPRSTSPSRGKEILGPKCNRPVGAVILLPRLGGLLRSTAFTEAARWVTRLGAVPRVRNVKLKYAWLGRYVSFYSCFTRLNF